MSGKADQPDHENEPTGDAADTPLRTPWQRRLVYGANVAALIAAVAVIVVFANWLAAERVRQWGGWARLDLTATRKYSLSDQTRKLLGNLDQPVRITTVFADGMGLPAELERRIRYFRDLLEEYERLGGVEVEHVDPAEDIEAYDRLVERIKTIYAESLEPLRRNIGRARSTLAASTERLERINAYIASNIPMLERQAPGLSDWMRRIGLPLSKGAAEELGFDELIQRIDDLDTGGLADYSGLRQTLLDAMRRLRDRGLQRYVDRLEEIDEAAAPSEVVAFASGLRSMIDRTREELSSVMDKLEAASVEDYARTRRSIQQSNAILVSTSKSATAIELDQVYTPAPAGDDEEAGATQRFRGEEAVTSAIIALTRDVRPMVVFVNPMTMNAVGRGGLMSYVADRLEAMGMEVRQWRTGAGRSPMGPTPPTPRPEPAEGQPTVWVYLAPPGDPREMFSEGLSTAREDFAATLDRGENLLVFVPFWPGAGVGASGPQSPPYVEPLASAGITAETDKRLFSQLPGPRGEPLAVPLVQVTDWPDAHPIGEALQGQVGILGGLSMHRSAPPGAAVPLRYDEQTPGMTIWPLIRTPAHVWAERGLGQDASPEESDPRGPFTVGLAAKRGGQRIVAIGDAMFAADLVTQVGERDFLSGRLLRAQYPANAELFLNSVYWLAGAEELIAASARVQDVRRFGPIQRAESLAVKWIALVGLPVVCLAGGGLMWLVRRR